MVIGSLSEKLRKFDWVLFGAVFLMLVIGFTALYSVSLGQEPLDFSNVKKQIIFAVVGMLFLFVASLFNYSAFRLYSRYLFLLSLILLVAVLLFGSTIRGTTGWLSIFGWRFQPVELVKIALILFLARFFAHRYQQFQEPRHLVVSFVGTIIMVGLVLLQPDVGSAAVLFGIWLIMLILSGVRGRYLLMMGLIMLVAITSMWGFGLKDYQKDRVLTFIDPTLDPLGSGYNVTQAIIAVGSGGFWGRGLGFGSQSQLKFIPESQTDFVFAVVAEELGFFGVTLLLGLWVLIFYRLIRIAKRARDDFGMYMVLGISAMFFIHLMVNVGMNMGLLPVTGISLPFVSLGGSFLLTSLFTIGMAQSVAVNT